MGREIRRVPPNWMHPKYTQENAPGPSRIGEYRDCYDETFDDALAKWIEGYQMWKAGTHRDQLSPTCPTDGLEFYEWEGGPPNPLHYRAAFTEEPTWFQVYQTVSEGTPVSPPFATLLEVVEYLVQHGEYGGSPVSRAYAEQFVKDGWAVSMVRDSAGIRSNYETTLVDRPQ